MGYAKESGFGMKLNTLSDDLPAFGTVVWKKIKNHEGRTDVEAVELINLMNDPAVKSLKDGIVIERHVLTQSDLRRYTAWDQDAVNDLISAGQTISRVGFLDTNQSSLHGSTKCMRCGLRFLGGCTNSTSVEVSLGYINEGYRRSRSSQEQ